MAPKLKEGVPNRMEPGVKKSNRLGQILYRQLERGVVTSSGRVKFARVRPGSRLLQGRSILRSRQQQG